MWVISLEILTNINTNWDKLPLIGCCYLKRNLVIWKETVIINHCGFSLFSTDVNSLKSGLSCQWSRRVVPCRNSPNFNRNFIRHFFIMFLTALLCVLCYCGHILSHPHHPAGRDSSPAVIISSASGSSGSPSSSGHRHRHERHQRQVHEINNVVSRTLFVF